MTYARTSIVGHPIAPIFLSRWSPRSLSGEEITDEALLTLFEAARWSPSSHNAQPWRFIYSKRGSGAWPKFLGLLSEHDQSWAKNASALIVVVSKTTFTPPGRHMPTISHSHSFDAGVAWANLALQAALVGWHAHAVAEFDIDRIRSALNVPRDHRVEAIVSVGRLGELKLPDALQALRTLDVRRPLAEIALEGGFPPAAEVRRGRRQK